MSLESSSGPGSDHDGASTSNVVSAKTASWAARSRGWWGRQRAPGALALSYGPGSALGGARRPVCGLFAEYRGQGIGSEAQRLLVEYLFATSPANSVQVGTEAGNFAEQRGLSRRLGPSERA